jgi:hypothetical protein
VVQVWWQKAECPVRDEERLWIEESLDWFVSEFGTDVLKRTVVQPDASWFPSDYSGSEDDVRALFGKVCDRLDVPVARVRLDLEPDEPDELLEHLPMFHTQSAGATAHWQRRDGVTVVALDMKLAQRPVAVVATLAHELGHERLLGEHRIDPDRRDGEPLTDLFTVFFGFGIFNANAAFDFRPNLGPSGVGRLTSVNSYRTQRLGYLTEAMYGYALARYAWLRGETKPDWAHHLDTNPREWMKQGLRYLAAGVG